MGAGGMAGVAGGAGLATLCAGAAVLYYRRKLASRKLAVSKKPRSPGGRNSCRNSCRLVPGTKRQSEYKNLGERNLGEVNLGVLAGGAGGGGGANGLPSGWAEATDDQVTLALTLTLTLTLTPNPTLTLTLTLTLTRACMSTTRRTPRPEATIRR